MQTTRNFVICIALIFAAVDANAGAHIASWNPQARQKSVRQAAAAQKRRHTLPVLGRLERARLAASNLILRHPLEARRLRRVIAEINLSQEPLNREQVRHAEQVLAHLSAGLVDSLPTAGSDHTFMLTQTGLSSRREIEDGSWIQIVGGRQLFFDSRGRLMSALIVADNPRDRLVALEQTTVKRVLREDPSLYPALILVTRHFVEVGQVPWQNAPALVALD